MQVENFRTPNFALVADILYWLVYRSVLHLFWVLYVCAWYEGEEITHMKNCVPQTLKFAMYHWTSKSNSIPTRQYIYSLRSLYVYTVKGIGYLTCEQIAFREHLNVNAALKLTCQIRSPFSDFGRNWNRERSHLLHHTSSTGLWKQQGKYRLTYL